jgi:hypothetical protein
VRPRGKAGCEPGHNMIIGGKERSAAQGGNLSVKALPSLRACGARPSAGLVIRARMASRGKAGNNVEGGFLGGTHSVRPRGKAGCEPGHVMIAGGWAKRPMAKRRCARVGVMPSLRACGARPSAGLVIRARMASRGKAGNDVEGGFLGGTHSVRPRGKAGCEPGHNISIGGERIPGGQMGTCSGEANSVVVGVRSPPLRGEGRPGQDGLPGEGRR